MKSSKKLNPTNQNGALDKDRLHLFCSKSRKKSVTRPPQGNRKTPPRNVIKWLDEKCSGSQRLARMMGATVPVRCPVP